MRDFRHGDLQVLLCGIPAIRLGHNLDTASVVVVNGLVFSYEMFDQFIARAHRLSSRKPVTVYVMLTKGSLDEKKWELLSAKAAAADLALDGQLMDEREEPISLEKVLKELQAPRRSADRRGGRGGGAARGVGGEHERHRAPAATDAPGRGRASTGYRAARSCSRRSSIASTSGCHSPSSLQKWAPTRRPSTLSMRALQVTCAKVDE